MFCSNCGVKASGNFCSACGHRLRSPSGPSAGASSSETRSEPKAFTGDWSQLLEYETLVQIPEVRASIQEYGEQAKANLNPFDLFRLLDKAGVPVPMTAIATVAQPVSEGLGFKTQGSKSGVFPHPPGRILVALLCALARGGQKVERVEQAEDGCVIHSTLPATLFSLKGNLRFAVSRDGVGTKLESSSLFKGQIYHHGKSQRCLRKVFTAVEEIAPTLRG